MMLTGPMRMADASPMSTTRQEATEMAATLWASELDVLEHWYRTTRPADGYTVAGESWENDEGSTFATVTITLANGEQIVERFASYFDSPAESATEQAASFIAAFEESQTFTLEERLGVFGLEWEREMQEGRSF